MPTRVKVCGITSIQDARAAIDAGADALGFVFYPPSPRYISVESAAVIMEQLPAFVCTVGLFVNASVDEIEHCIERTQVDLLQFHGDEDAAFCESFSRPYIKALRVNSDVHKPSDVAELAQAYSSARGILLDTYRKGVPGGTGESFDWGLVPTSIDNVILAGGLTPQNVAGAIATVRPYAVDVSGGVEASHGIKDTVKIQQFFTAVLDGDTSNGKSIL